MFFHLMRISAVTSACNEQALVRKSGGQSYPGWHNLPPRCCTARCISLRESWARAGYQHPRELGLSDPASYPWDKQGLALFMDLSRKIGNISRSAA